MFSSVTRAGLAGLAAVAMVGLSACGDGGGAASVTTINLRPSSYELKPPATASSVPTVAEPDEEGRSQAEQTYTIQSNDDVPFNIAAKFEVDLEELRNYNGWDEDYSGWPGVGGTVRIPPGAKFIDQSTTTTTAAGSDSEDGGDEEDATTATRAPGDCSPGTHELEEGDYPVTVARKYDITLEQLLAANGWALDASGNVPQWPGPGGEVAIPPSGDCATTTTTAAPG
jgi:hypothetical protein